MRLFLALELSDSVRVALENLQDRLCRKLEGWRWVKPGAVHLTLRFLGEVSEDDDAILRPVWRRAAAECPAVRFRPGGLGVFPPRGSPRVLWVGVQDEHPPGGLTQLGERVERAARESGFDPEQRPFRAHLTLARGQRGHRASRPTPDDGCEFEEMTAREVVLYRGELLPGGARHTVLERFRLGE